MAKDKKKKVEIEMSADKLEKPKPTMHLDGNDTIDGLSLGDEVTLKVKAKLTGDRLDEYMDDERCQTFQILGIEKKTEVSAKERLAKMAQSTNKGMSE